MALADGSSTSRAVSPSKISAAFETFEPRRLFAYTPVGMAGKVGTNVTAVESAAASNDAQSTRYATYVDNTGNGYVVSVIGADDATPGMPILLPNQGGTVSQTDVAAESGNGSAVVTYTVTKTNASNGVADSDVYAVVVANNQLVGPATLVNSTTPGNQSNARVSEFANGGFVVAWQSNGTGNNATNGIVARQFTSSGLGNGAEFSVATTGSTPDVSANSQGNFVVVWSSGSGTFSRAFDSTSASINTQQTVSSTALFSNPSVGFANNGNYLVAYGNTLGNVRLIQGQVFQGGGTAVGNAFTVSDNNTANQTSPVVAVDSNSGFVVGYAQASSGNNFNTAAFRPFNAVGTALDGSTVVGGVTFGTDFRFGLASRIPGTVHAAYNLAGVANIQQYTNGNGGGNTPTPERPVPAGALLIDLTTSTAGRVVNVALANGIYTVTVDGTATTYTAANYTSVYVRGGNFDDSITLESSVVVPSIIYARNGIDTVQGGSGRDVIDGGDGGDRSVTARGRTRILRFGNLLYGNAGSDYIYGGGDNDTIYGGANSDRLLTGPGTFNYVYGGNGNDRLFGGSRGNLLYGENGDDTLTSGSGGEFLDGGNDNDVLTGNDGNDTLFGGAGDDQLGGDAGNDLLHGGRGTDRVFGNTGNDTLYGDQGADLLRGGGGVSEGLGSTPGDVGYIDGTDTVVGITFRINVR